MAGLFQQHLIENIFNPALCIKTQDTVLSFPLLIWDQAILSCFLRITFKTMGLSRQ